jgi:hypothetical protein
MSDEERKPAWLASWRAKGDLKRQRRWWWNPGMGVDSEEKMAQRYTSRGRELAAEDRRYEIKGGAGGGPA